MTDKEYVIADCPECNTTQGIPCLGHLVVGLRRDKNSAEARAKRLETERDEARALFEECKDAPLAAITATNELSHTRRERDEALKRVAELEQMLDPPLTEEQKANLPKLWERINDPNVCDYCDTAGGHEDEECPGFLIARAEKAERERDEWKQKAETWYEANLGYQAERDILDGVIDKYADPDNWRGDRMRDGWIFAQNVKRKIGHERSARHD